MGFQNLRTLNVQVNSGHMMPPLMDEFYEYVEGNGLVIVLNSKKVSVSYQNWHMPCWRDFDMDKLREMMEQQVTRLKELNDLISPHVIMR